MTQPRPPHLDYATPNQSRPVFSLAAFLTSGIVILVISAVFVFLTPPLKEIFRDFKIDLPAITIHYLNLAEFYRQIGWVGAVLLPPILGFACAPMMRRPTSEDLPAGRVLRNLLLLNIVLWCVLAFVIVSAVALIMPIFTLISAVSGAHAR